MKSTAAALHLLFMTLFCFLILTTFVTAEPYVSAIGAACTFDLNDLVKVYGDYEFVFGPEMNRGDYVGFIGESEKFRFMVIIQPDSEICILWDQLKVVVDDRPI